MVGLDADLYEFISDTMRHWVGKNFGASEAKEPSWNINELSMYLTKAINKRTYDINNLMDFGLVIKTKKNSAEERDKFVERIREKLDRVGGILCSWGQEDTKFERPISGETEGYYMNLILKLPDNGHQIGAFDRWLDRQKEGQGGMLEQNLIQTSTSQRITTIW